MKPHRTATLGLSAVALLLLTGLAAIVGARYRGRGFVAEPGKAAANFTLLSDAGTPTSLASFHGRSVAMLVIPPDAALDGPTAAAIAEIARRSEANGVTFLTVSADSLPKTLGGLPGHLRDHAGDVASLYMVLDRPTVFLIDARGMITQRLSIRDAATRA